jgi:hypothetical protein
MTKLTPLFASARTAAALFDIPEAKFMELVEAGHLPRATPIGGGVKRWDVALLKKIATGAAAEEGEMEW